MKPFSLPLARTEAGRTALSAGSRHLPVPGTRLGARCLARFALGLALLAGGLPASTRAAEAPIPFRELYDLLQTNLAGVSAAELNRAAVEGLVSQLGGRVSVAGVGGAETNAAPMLTAAVFDRHYGYLRVGRVAAGLDREFTNTLQRLTATNKLKGLVLDLRFAGGQDFAAALSVADQFFPGEQPLIDWGAGVKNSTSKPEAIVLPVALLVNRRTSGAAEALAGMLRFSDVGLVLGTNSAGQASVQREFTLQGGQRVRVAVAPVKVAKNQPLPASGLKPDILVEVAPEDELAWFEDAYKVLPRAGRGVTNELSLQVTNRPPRRRMNEAELVRMSREGISPDGEGTNGPARRSEPTPAPVINDPVLARAIDLLKGLAVVQQFRSI